MYVPYAAFRPLALALEALEDGDGTLFIKMAKGTEKKVECSCGGEDSWPKCPLADISGAIACGDGILVNHGPAELYDRYLEMEEEHSSFAGLWVRVGALCTYVFYFSHDLWGLWGWFSEVGKCVPLKDSWVRNLLFSC